MNFCFETLWNTWPQSSTTQARVTFWFSFPTAYPSQVIQWGKKESKRFANHFCFCLFSLGTRSMQECPVLLFTTVMLLVVEEEKERFQTDNLLEQ